MSLSTPPLSQANILVIDDSPDNLELLRLLLEAEGHQPRVVSDSVRALECIRLDPPDLILLDVNMPVMNGYELCERLRADPCLKEIPVLFLSGAVQIADKVRAFQAGGVDYIAKPFEIEELNARVRTQLALRRQNLELQQSYERLRALELLRDNLVHMIVQDLRSPIHSLHFALETLADNLRGSPPPALDLLQRARDQVERLSRMTNQLLDISRLEAGQMPLNRQVGDLVQAAHAAIESIAAFNRNPARRITVSGSVVAAYDTEIVRRIIENLLINALKFSTEGREIRISITREGDTARVAIADDGPGIPVEHQERIFEKFAQVNAEHKRFGAGLGLAFCKLAAEAHGGRIGVNSAPGPGSVFWFTLPKGGE